MEENVKFKVETNGEQETLTKAPTQESMQQAMQQYVNELQRENTALRNMLQDKQFERYTIRIEYLIKVLDLCTRVVFDPEFCDKCKAELMELMMPPVPEKADKPVTEKEVKDANTAAK